MKYNIAIIGYGKIGKLRHKFLIKLKILNNIFIYDKNDTLNSNVKSYNEIFSNPDIDHQTMILQKNLVFLFLLIY